MSSKYVWDFRLPSQVLLGKYWYLLSLFALVVSLSGCLSRMEEITEQTKDQVKGSNEKMSELQRGTQVLESIGQLTLESDNLRAAAMQRLVKLFDDEKRLNEYFGMPAPLYLPSIKKLFLNPKEKRLTDVTLPNITIVSRDPQSPRVLLKLGKFSVQSDGSRDVAPPAHLLMVNTMSEEVYETAWRNFAKFFESYARFKHMGGIDPPDEADLVAIAPRLIRIASGVFGAAYDTDVLAYAQGDVPTIRPKAERWELVGMARCMLDFIDRFGLDKKLEIETRTFIKDRMQLDEADL